jgi:uncharacterized damage-inducible protein DinB
LTPSAETGGAAAGLAELSRGLERLEAERQDLLDALAGLDEERLRRPGPDGGWSVLEILGHLTLAEQHTLTYLQKKLQDPAAIPRAGLGSFWRFALLSVVLRSPLRVKAPERVAHPVTEASLAEVRARWEEVRRGWREVLASFPPALVERAVFRHPFVGRLSLAHTLGFLREHVAHHRRQIERRLS